MGPSAKVASPTGWVWLAIFVLSLALPASSAAQELRGGIRGYVRDADFSTPVPGAGAGLVGTGKGAVSDENGVFAFFDLAPGTYTVVVAREGYRSQRIEGVVVEGGRFREIEVSLVAELLDVDEMAFQGEDLLSENAVALLDVQQNLTSISTVLGADFISKLGASDVGKALQKVAGISVVGDRYIVVRGLADRYNSVTLNGLVVPSSDPDRRAVNIDLFPGSIVRTIDTSKTFVPWLPGEATGASVDITTKGVPEKNFAKVKLGLGFDSAATGNNNYLTYPGGGTGMLGTRNERALPDFMKTADLPDTGGDPVLLDKINDTLPRPMGGINRAPGPDFTFESAIGVTGTFMGSPSGLLFATDYRKQYRITSGTEGRYSFRQIGDDSLPVGVARFNHIERSTETLRGSMLLSAGIEPKPGEFIKATFFANVAAQDRVAIRLGPKDFQPGATDFNSLFYRETLAYVERRLATLQLNGRHVLDDGFLGEKPTVDWGMAYSMSSQYEPDQRFTQSDVTPDGQEYFQPGAVPIPPVRRYWRNLDDTRWALRLDFSSQIFGDETRNAILKAGGGFDYSTRDYEAYNFAYNIGQENGRYPSDLKPPPYAGATLADVWNYGNARIADLSNPQLGTYLFRFTQEEAYYATQAIPSAYAAMDFDLGSNVNATVGFRFEQTSIRIAASDILNAEPDVRILLLPPEDRTPQNIRDLFNPAAGKTNPAIQAAKSVAIEESHVLPSVSLSYEISPGMKLRGAWSRTIARPSFKELAPVAFRDAESGEFFVGNKNLKISDIDNFDVRFEWYPPGGGLLALTAFSKYIQNPIELTNRGAYVFENGPDGVVYGFEIELEKDLGFISESLRGLAISANYSYMRSVVPRDPTRGSIFGTNRRLQGQPDYVFNANLTYSNKDFADLSAGVFLNVTGIYLAELGAGPVADIFVEPVSSLNAFLSWRISPQAKLTFRANNLITTPLRSVYDNGQRNLYESRSTSTTYSITFEYEM